MIVGGGLAGLTCALACAHKGAKVAVIDAADPKALLKADFDGRASAIAASSYQMYRHLGIHDRLGDDVQPISDILISDGEAGHAPSPLTLHFDADQIDEPAMGYMIENRRLRRALLDGISAADNITLIAPAKVVSTGTDAAHAVVELDGGKVVSAKLIVAADGRNSRLRSGAGISVTSWPYKQKAIVTTVKHELDHSGVAHELFLPSGPFAILPLTDNRASIVWTDSPAAVDAAMKLPDEAFAAELARRFGGFLGDVAPCAPRWAYPLSLQMAEEYTSARLALIGDAAHAIHPIAGQGLNMGLRDAAALADVFAEAREGGLDIGGDGALDSYEQWRRFDNAVLAAATDVFNRLFSNNIPPVKHARRLGLGLVDKLAPARSFFMREASGQMGELPSLLRR